jgi:hypothetical protein
MKQYFILLFILISSGWTIAQNDNSVNNVNKVFEFHLDSIERIVTLNKWRDTDYFIHYTVRNITKDTFTYITNSSSQSLLKGTLRKIKKQH